jgi:hypothetical protein
VNYQQKSPSSIWVYSDFQDFLLAGVQHWEKTCRIRDAFLAHEAKCPKDHDDIYQFIERCIRDFRAKAAAVEACLRQIEKDYEVDNADEFRNALGEAELLTRDFSKLKRTTPLNSEEF